MATTGIPTCARGFRNAPGTGTKSRARQARVDYVLSEASARVKVTGPGSDSGNRDARSVEVRFLTRAGRDTPAFNTIEEAFAVVGSATARIPLLSDDLLEVVGKPEVRELARRFGICAFLVRVGDHETTTLLDMRESWGMAEAISPGDPVHEVAGKIGILDFSEISSDC